MAALAAPGAPWLFMAVAVYFHLTRRRLCPHEWMFVRNIHGDEINHSGGKRSIWNCAECLARRCGNELHDVERKPPRCLCGLPIWLCDASCAEATSAQLARARLFMLPEPLSHIAMGDPAAGAPDFVRQVIATLND